VLSKHVKNGIEKLTLQRVKKLELLTLQHVN